MLTLVLFLVLLCGTVYEYADMHSCKIIGVIHLSFTPKNMRFEIITMGGHYDLVC
jgi:hypothetical protein